MEFLDDSELTAFEESPKTAMLVFQFFVNRVDGKLIGLAKRLSESEKENLCLKRKVAILENILRRKNIFVFGAESEIGELAEVAVLEIKEKLLLFLESKLGISMNKSDVEYIRVSHGKAGKGSVLILEMASFRKRAEVLEN